MTTPITELQLTQLQLDLDYASLTEEAAQAAYDRAEAEDIETAAIEPYVRVIILRQIMMGAAKQYDTRVNEVDLKKSQINKPLMTMYNLWLGEYQKALDTGGGVLYGGLRRKPTWLFELPDDVQ